MNLEKLLKFIWDNYTDFYISKLMFPKTMRNNQSTFSMKVSDDGKSIDVTTGGETVTFLAVGKKEKSADRKDIYPDFIDYVDKSGLNSEELKKTYLYKTYYSDDFRDRRKFLEKKREKNGPDFLSIFAPSRKKNVTKEQKITFI